MYYPDEKVEEVLRANNIVDVVGTYVHLQKKGANYFGLCPFHNEKSPAFSVSEPKQMFYCFGCGAGGNAVTFLMKYENYSFQEALQTLADRAGIKLPEVDYTEETRRREEKRKQLPPQRQMQTRQQHPHSLPLSPCSPLAPPSGSRVLPPLARLKPPTGRWPP